MHYKYAGTQTQPWMRIISGAWKGANSLLSQFQTLNNILEIASRLW